MAEILLEKKLAACVQLKEIESLYMWKGKMEREIEMQAVIKTKKTLYKRVEEAIIKNHSYDLPQVVGVNIDAGSKGYLQWLDEEVLS